MQPLAQGRRTAFPPLSSAYVDPGEDLRDLAGEDDLDADNAEDEMQPVGVIREATLLRARVPDLLEDVGSAVVAVRRAERDLARRVRAARAHGASWEDIGVTLGMSRQGAAKRYG